MEGSKVNTIKKGKPDDAPSSYRPICLIDEISKLLERVIAHRIHLQLTTHGPDLSPNQYGFRRGRSMTDAIIHAKQTIRDIECRGNLAMGICLDISNAFNSVKWSNIIDAARRRDFPEYLTMIYNRQLLER